MMTVPVSRYRWTKESIFMPARTEKNRESFRTPGLDFQTVYTRCSAREMMSFCISVVMSTK